MDKTVYIAGNPIRFKASGAFPLKYKAATARDLFADLNAIIEQGGLDQLQVIYDILHTMAACADPGIPPLEEWLDSFEEFPVFSIFNEVSSTLWASFRTQKKSEAGAAAARRSIRNSIFSRRSPRG